MRIGIMGGTFDPIHIGHLILGETAWQQFGLDKVLYMPAGNPPHKRNRAGRASDEQRMEMVRKAIEGNPHFELSDLEMNADGYTYTYRTLERMRRESPDDSLFFIIGADSLADFHLWKEPPRIAAACTLIVACRDHIRSEILEQQIENVCQKFGAVIHILNTRNIDISSHEIRSFVEEKRSIRYYVPDSVREYIAANGIYTKS